MPKSLRLRPVTDAMRPAKALSTSPIRNVGLAPADLASANSRAAPWLAFNATVLPAPVADSAPDFGPNRFLLGANLPWVRYGLDFGASAATPEGGLHADSEGQALLDEALARLRKEGVEAARVFLFCDGRAGLRFASDGTPQGLDDAVLKDVDVLLAAAERHRIGLFLVLFDAGLVAEASSSGGVRTGGHADVLSESAKRDALLERVVEPLLRRYGTHPAIEAWDVFDEPECATLGMHCPHPPRTKGAQRWGRLWGAASKVARALGVARTCALGPSLLPPAEMRTFLGAAVQLVHKHTRAMATVGLASTANLCLVQGLGLDVYQAHWWEAYGDGPLRRAAADFRLDRPLLLGAFPATTKSKSVKTVLDTARCAGYGGALLWSLRAVDSRGGLDAQLGQLGHWAKNHATHLHRRPARVEVAAEPLPLKPVEEVAPSPAAVVEAHEAAEMAEDEEPRAARTEVEGGVPGLVAAPA
jgi:hypothetical protein